ncbi:MAG: hypothetical protein ACK2U9_15995, partial [Anaerolineae bacterium]
MTQQTSGPNRKRRLLLKGLGGGLVATAGMSLLPPRLKRILSPIGVAEAQSGAPYDLYWAGTDGWIYLPPAPAIPPFHPDDLGPAL